MPNWCCTTFLVSGSKENLQDFCDNLNEAVAKSDPDNNGFGRNWLGNIYTTLGGDKTDYKKGYMHVRGVIEKDGCANLFGPDGLEGDLGLEVEDLSDGKGLVQFTITHAWEAPWDFVNWLFDRFPDVEYGFETTDEFGNFHYVDGEVIKPRYELQIDGEWYTSWEKGDEQKVVDLIEEKTGLRLDVTDLKDALSDEKAEERIVERIANLVEQSEDLEGLHWEFYTYKDIAPSYPYFEPE